MAASFDVAFKRSPIKTLHSAITTPTGVVEAQSVGFSFYSAAEVRKISVVQVHTAEQRDAHNRPLPGGLYDPAMGPTDQYESCKTCGLDYTTCPGHLGHIELALPAYTPVLFPQLVTLLRSTCLLCHRLKADAGKLRILADALRLLDAGLLVAATVLMEGRAATGGGGGGGGDDDDDVDVDSDDSDDEERGRAQRARGAQRAALRRRAARARGRQQRRRRAGGGADDAAVDARARCAAAAHKIQRTMLHGAKCSRCGRSSGAIKGEEGTRSSAQRRASPPPSPMRCCPPATATATATTPARTLAAATPTMTTATTATATATPPPPTAAPTAQGAAPAAAPAAAPPPRRCCTPPPAAAAAAAAAKGPKFMTTSEAERHISKLWRQEGDLLRIIFPHLSASAFFLHVLAVPPSRFRPPSKVGDDVFEHAQNVWLGKVLAANIQLLQLQSQPAAENGGDGAAAAADEGRRKERVLRAWGELNRAVACVTDATKSGAQGSAAASEPPGVKQTLERKEGLFRKHMMGKRVNFAARSVISPDPYIGTHEIGVPLHFATTLTYPEPVTPWNVSQLRQAVINGARVHPGASHVQLPTGELIDLSRRSHAQRAALAKRLLLGADESAAPTPLAAAGGAAGATPNSGKGARPRRWRARRRRRRRRRAVAEPRRRHQQRRRADGDASACGATCGRATSCWSTASRRCKPGIMAHTARVLKGERDSHALRQLQHVQCRL